MYWKNLIILKKESKCLVCNGKKSKFLKEQEARGLLSNLTGVKILILTFIKCFILKVWK